MKKKFLSIILVLGLMLPILPAGAIASSADIENHWAKTNIEILQAKGIMNGDS